MLFLCAGKKNRTTSLVLVFPVLALALALAVRPARTEPATAPAPVAAPQRPDVSLDIIADREGVEVGEQLPLVLIVTNKSDTPLTAVTVWVPSASFQLVHDAAHGASLPDALAAFGTAQGTITLEPRKEQPKVPGEAAPSPFGSHKVPVVVEYTWLRNGVTTRSAQTGTVSLNVRRRFEEESKSLPGGTAAFLYLILPIVPAFFAFDAVDRLRKGEPLQMPKFGTEHIFPAFLLSLLLSVVIVTLRSVNVDLAYSNPIQFIGFLAGSAVLGALLPGVRWVYAVVERQRWGFRHTDQAADYLRKALLSPYRPSDVEWVEGAAGGVNWAGIRLWQPDKTMALGPRLQVTPAGADDKQRKEQWKILTTEIFDSSEALIDARRLVEMVKAHTLAIGYLGRVTRGGDPISSVVATEGLAQFQQTASRPMALVEPKQ